MDCSAQAVSAAKQLSASASITLVSSALTLFTGKAGFNSAQKCQQRRSDKTVVSVAVTEDAVACLAIDCALQQLVLLTGRLSAHRNVR